jgi:hypothetical protein
VAGSNNLNSDLDPDGDLEVQDDDAILMKLDPDLNLVWAREREPDLLRFFP